MIGKEIVDKTESVEIPENKFTEITADKTSIEETKTFWNRVFYGESDEVSEETLWNEIMYCDELDFDFSDVVTDDTKEVLELFNSDNWEKLDVDERYELITELVDSIGQGLGLENIPEIELVNREDNCSGYYSERGNYIGINMNYWDDYKDIVDTMSLIKKSIGIIIFDLLTMGAFKIICFDFKDRGVIPSSSFDWGIVYYLVYVIGVIIIAGAIWLFIEKRKAKKLAKAEQIVTVQE